ncbi:DUF2740 family protein [Salmonella enterica subsp. enterica]|nr:DUF2740 family protein [Salmonella enterica subsp. enterica]
MTGVVCQNNSITAGQNYQSILRDRFLSSFKTFWSIPGLSWKVKLILKRKVMW